MTGDHQSAKANDSRTIPMRDNDQSSKQTQWILSSGKVGVKTCQQQQLEGFTLAFNNDNRCKGPIYALYLRQADGSTRAMRVERSAAVRAWAELDPAVQRKQHH
eukprot:scaffold212840_cov20-Prasinocladus_malaysianus.AAC.1